MILFLIKVTDKLLDSLRLIPFFILILSYILMRLLFLYIIPDFTNFTNSISLLTMILSTIFSISLLFHLTNKFKTRTNMKLLKNYKEVNKDDSRRIIRK